MSVQQAEPDDDPVAVVRRYIEAFNAGDADAMAGCFAPQASILDGMAPHVWRGASPARDWYRDVLVEGDHVGASDYRVTWILPCMQTSRKTPPMWWFPRR